MVLNSIYKKNFNYIKNAIDYDRIFHACIFHGSDIESIFDFVKKEFIRYIQCENRGDTFCGKCGNCKNIESNSDIIPGTFIVAPAEKNKKISIDSIREAQKFLDLTTFGSNKKFLVINYAQNMTIEAREALLKTLEEPTSNSIIILIADDKKKMSPTIISRCQSLFFLSKREVKFDEESMGEVSILVGDKIFDKIGLVKDVCADKSLPDRIQGWVEILYTEMMIGEGVENLGNIVVNKQNLLERKLNRGKITSVINKLLDTLEILDGSNVNEKILLENLVLGL